MRSLFRTILISCCSLFATAVWSQTMTFEGLKNGELANGFYNGTGGSLGSVGPNFGVVFSNGVAFIDSDAGGTGNFANEPSPSTALAFISANAATMNVAAGFSTGFAFKYSAASPASVTVFDGLNGTGNVLATLPLVAQFNANNCVGDPSGFFCNWTEVGVTFNGIAKSVNFGGTANQVGLDDITINSAVVGGGGGAKTLEENIACAKDLTNQLQPNQVMGPAQKNMMVGLLNSVLFYRTTYPSLSLFMIDAVTARADGCPLRKAPDTVLNMGATGLDFVTDCNAQFPIYQCLRDARAQLAPPPI